MLEDVCYSTRSDMSWSDVKKSLARVKKFKKMGWYLEINQTSIGKPTALPRYFRYDRFTCRVMGPPQNTQQ